MQGYALWRCSPEGPRHLCTERDRRAFADRGSGEQSVEPERASRKPTSIIYWESLRNAAAVSGNSFKLASIRSRQRGPRARASL